MCEVQCSAHLEEFTINSQCSPSVQRTSSVTVEREMEGDKDTTMSRSETRSRSPSPIAGEMSLTVPTAQPAGRTRSSSPSTIPAPLIIKARSQVSRFEALQGLQSQFPKDSETTSLGEVQSLLDSVEELHKAFLTEHAHMEEFWPLKCLDHEYFVSNLMSREANLVAQLRRSLRRLMARYTQPSQPSSSDSASEVMASRAAKLPELAIPKFGGKFVEWPAFSEMFTSLIVKDSRLGDIDRLCYLRASLTDEPSRRVNGFPLRGSSFPAAWEYLEKRFSNKRLLIKEQLDKLLSISPISSRSAPALHDLAATITEVNETLIALGADKQMHNCLMVHVLTNSLDKVTREAWETSLANSTECPNYKGPAGLCGEQRWRLRADGGSIEEASGPFNLHCSLISEEDHCSPCNAGKISTPEVLKGSGVAISLRLVQR